MPRSREIETDPASDGALELEKFDFSAPAELFPRKHASKPKQIGYLRFASAAEAIRHAIEVVPPTLLIGTSMLVGDERYIGKDIRKLYDNADYPLYRL
ncbi:MAG: hypothetical protein WAW96_07685 [Alphaproteobacteria bacterium]